MPKATPRPEPPLTDKPPSSAPVFAVEHLRMIPDATRQEVRNAAALANLQFSPACTDGPGPAPWCRRSSRGGRGESGKWRARRQAAPEHRLSTRHPTPHPQASTGTGWRWLRRANPSKVNQALAPQGRWTRRSQRSTNAWRTGTDRARPSTGSLRSRGRRCGKLPDRDRHRPAPEGAHDGSALSPLTHGAHRRRRSLMPPARAGPRGRRP